MNTKTLWAGRILSAVPALLMLMSAVMKLMQLPPVIEGFVGKFGYPQSAIVPIGVVELLCVVLYAIPRTSVLGAILVTGYLGGAIATHVRVGDVFLPPLVLGVVAWAGLYLRDERLRRLIPLSS
ncbi:MAG TPA: DoxX family protein [Vicinamibacteria bacterium]